MDLSTLSDADLQALHQQAGAASTDPTALSGLSDDQLRSLYKQAQGTDLGLPPDLAAAERNMGGATNTAARWLTFGLSDPVSAAGRATVEKYAAPLLGASTDANTPWAELYKRDLAQQRGRESTFATEHPYENAAAAGIGALAGAAPAMGWPTAIKTGAELPAMTAPATLGGRMLSGGGVGAATGAASGFSNSPTGSLTDTMLGAGGGAVAGLALPLIGELASVPIDAFSRRFLNGTDSQALDRIASRITQDAKAGGPGVSEIQQALSAANGKPLSLADVAGENVQALAGKVTRMPGEGREAAQNFLAERSSGAGPRLIGDINSGVSNAPAFHTAQDLMQQRATAATPKWQDFYAAPPLNPDHVQPSGELANMMSRPSMQQASRKALSIAQEEGRDPASLGITFNAAGDPAFEGVPSWQTLDYMKRGLDDVLDQYRNPLTGRLENLGEGGRAVLGTQKQFVNFLDNNNAAYAPARDAWAGPSSALSAIRQGQGFQSMRPELIDKTLTDMSPSEREFFRVGAADALRTSAAKTGDARQIIGANAVNQRGADYLKQQLRPLFDNEDSFNRFVQDVGNESLMQANTAKLVGNSATAGRMAEDAGGHGGGGALANAATIGGALLTGEPIVAASRMPALFNSLRNLGDRGANNPEVNAATARMLFSADQPQNSNTLASILARNPMPTQRLVRQAVPAAAQYVGSNPLIPLRTGGALASIIANLGPGEGAGAPR